MFLVSSCSCLRSINWSHVLSWEWRCSWSSADRRCSNYIWVINNFIAYKGAIYIRGFTVTWIYPLWIGINIRDFTISEESFNRCNCCWISPEVNKWFLHQYLKVYKSICSTILPAYIDKPKRTIEWLVIPSMVGNQNFQPLLNHLSTESTNFLRLS